MKKKYAAMRKNPLSKAQASFLKESLRKLLGSGLVEEVEKKPEDMKEVVLRNALNSIILNR